MNKRNDQDAPRNGPDPLARLLRLAGTRREPDPDAEQRVRALVHDEWRRSVSQRGRRQRVLYALAASVVLVSVASVLTLRQASPPVETAATLVRVMGAVERRSGRTWMALMPGDTVHAGDHVRTGAGGRVALRLDNGVGVRMDYRSVLQIVDPATLSLERGGIYVDSGSEDGPPIDVITLLGRVRDIGTRFEVRHESDALTVRVRHGRIMLNDVHGDLSAAAAGTQLRVSASARVARDVVAANDPAWAWATTVAPAYVLDGRPLSGFLDWVARETGRRVLYADSTVSSQADATVLRGSIDGLTPDQALGAVIATTDFTANTSDTVIRVSR